MGATGPPPLEARCAACPSRAKGDEPRATVPPRCPLPGRPSRWRCCCPQAAAQRAGRGWRRPRRDGGARAARSVSVGPAAGSMARAARGRGGRGGSRQPGRLQKLRLAVQEFVQAAGGLSPPQPGLQPAGGRGRRSRRELRKEKRRLKRSRRRRLHPQQPGEPGAGRGEQTPGVGQCPLPAGVPASPPPGHQRPREAAKRLPQKGPGAAAAASARKRALLAANEEEEKEIRRLERRLGLSKRRKAGASSVPQSFVRDGLGYVLGALEPEATLCGLYEESSEEEAAADEGPLDLDEANKEDLDLESLDDDQEGELNGEEEEKEGRMEDTLETSEEADMEGNWEDEREGSRKLPMSPEDCGDHKPCKAKTSKEEQSLCHRATMYVPPPVRRADETTDDKKREELGRLKKTVKGLINRLSEPNLASISGQLEELYMTNSRKDMNETLTDVLLNACVTAAVMPVRLMMEHVLLVSILHHTVGIEVGAHFLEAVVRKFDEFYKSDTEGKECDNLFALIGHLYNFHVVHSLLIFDILKMLVSTFTEKDIELILLLLKNVGFSLRKDDALALKDLISESQNKANAVGKKFQDQSRIRFMLETMLALKNNDMRKIPGYDPEPVEKLRKLQRTLVHNSGSGRETQLRVSLESLLNADQVGRWWIVGSSWSGAPMIDSTSSKTQHKLPVGKMNSKILELARKQRMNTDIRRNIFCVLMSSEDFLDAFEKLLKLGLKDQQEREIVHVLVDCCLQEKTYNPFYAYLANKFCEYDRRFQMTFQFSIWDKIRDLGNLSTTTFSNLVSLLAHLLKTKSLSLSVFKVVEFSELDKPKVHFLRQVLHILLIKTDLEELTSIFGRLTDNPKLGMLREGLKLFLSHFFLKNVQAHKSAEEAILLKERVELVSRTLQARESRLKL
ncbi:nucleolar MIF4G domain-containing protein 1 [Dermochelys coriacea]|uniref:nucleolar MIF4G domain-containing protein 1 n=1 Tax=Dermochelys coriacea TaxID=27794 RepID=UPI0018E865F1|nr:nucleolar MIF4G domain-containing protein 1 [Dermochelys coriacea]